MEAKRQGPLYRVIASAIDARRRCQASTMAHHKEWIGRHEERLKQIEHDLLPSGSGIDNGTKIDLEFSDGERILLNTAFHHMDENGHYDGWTEHVIQVKASLIHTLKMKISGTNRNDIKPYLHEVFNQVLCEEVAWDDAKQKYVFARYVGVEEEEKKA